MILTLKPLAGTTQGLRLTKLGSEKIRMGGPGDERKNTEKADLVEKVGTGVVSMWETIGDPIRGGRGRVKDVLGHVRIFRDDLNMVNETYARTAAEAETE